MNLPKTSGRDQVLDLTFHVALLSPLHSDKGNEL